MHRKPAQHMTPKPAQHTAHTCASCDMSTNSSKSFSFALRVRSIAASWLSKPIRSSLSRLTICSYVLWMLCASLYLIMALSNRFSSVLMLRVRGVSSFFTLEISFSRSLSLSCMPSTCFWRSLSLFFTSSCLRLCTSTSFSSVRTSELPVLRPWSLMRFESVERRSLFSVLSLASASLFFLTSSCVCSNKFFRSLSSACRRATESDIGMSAQPRSRPRVHAP